MSKLVAKIEGMKCGHCVKHVEDALKEASNVESFKVEIGSAEVSGSITEAELKDLIEEEGYDVIEISK